MRDLVLLYTYVTGGPKVIWGVIGPILILLIIIAFINLIQNKKKSLLPRFLQSWDFLPLWMHSLAPYDKVMTSMPCCKSCRDEGDDTLSEVVPSSRSSVVMEKKGVDNPAMASDADTRVMTLSPKSLAIL